MKHVNEPPPSPRSIRHDISQAVEDSILKVLEKDRAARYATAGEFLQALSNAAYLSRDFWRPAHRLDHSTEAIPVPVQTPVPSPTPTPQPPAPVEQHAARPGPLPMDSPTLLPDPYTQIAAPPGIDPFDVPDPTQIGSAGDRKTLAPDPDLDEDQPPTLA